MTLHLSLSLSLSVSLSPLHYRDSTNHCKERLTRTNTRHEKKYLYKYLLRIVIKLVIATFMGPKLRQHQNYILQFIKKYKTLVTLRFK